MQWIVLLPQAQHAFHQRGAAGIAHFPQSGSRAQKSFAFRLASHAMQGTLTRNFNGQHRSATAKNFPPSGEHLPYRNSRAGFDSHCRLDATRMKASSRSFGVVRKIVLTETTLVVKEVTAPLVKAQRHSTTGDC